MLHDGARVVLGCYGRQGDSSGGNHFPDLRWRRFTRTDVGMIVDMESLEIEVDVNEAYIHRVKPEQPAQGASTRIPIGSFRLT